MKNIKLILVIISSCLFLNTYAIQNRDIPPKIIEAMQVGNAIELAKYFNSSIELAIFDKEDIYSKQQAEQIIKSYFEKNKIKTFIVLHQGGKEGAKYAICNLETTENKIFRVYFLIKENNGKPLIHQMRIEEE